MDKYFYRNLLIGFVLAVAGILTYNIYDVEKYGSTISYNDFLSRLEQNEIRRVHIRGNEIYGIDETNTPFRSYCPDVSRLEERLLAHGVQITGESSSPSAMSNFLTFGLPVLILFGWMVYSSKFMNRDKTAAFVKGQAKIFSRPLEKKVTFADVAGMPEAKEELMEVVDFLKHPERFSRLGGRIPKGVLLQGPPGTGKTLLAKAIAGEAGVAFFSISGSDFVEMFVGVGASRVRELFKQAKEHAPCIIFIDEIDTVGRRRGAAEAIGGQDEREQTLNALLVEMDGFGSNDTVVIVAATNRPEVLDPALLRPGRFDRQITVSIPDVMGRLEILRVHAGKIVTAEDLDLERIARGTPGFTGAELANLVNEAALIAVRHGKRAVDLQDFEEAKDRILMGPERKSLVINEKERLATAYHEAGHAILARILPEADPLHKVTIIPRGRAMGITQQLPLDERKTYSKEYLLNRIMILLGGRAAEEIALGQLTTGAVNDLERATDIAMKMVCEWGMSDTVGHLSYARPESTFMGGGLAFRHMSETTAREIDLEVKRIVEGCYEQTLTILENNSRLLHKLAEILLMDETVDAEELEIIFTCNANQERKLREKMARKREELAKMS